MKKTRSIVKSVFWGGVLLLFVFGCSTQRYSVDYGGCKDFFVGAKDSYRAGKAVTLYYDCIATETDYSFYLDGEAMNVKYDEKKGFVISFTMPEHDVELRVETRETILEWYTE